MNKYYSELQQTDMAHAINQMVELALPSFTKDKVLTINIEMSLLDYTNGKGVRREIKFVFHRPDGYTFVGAIMDDLSLAINENSKLEFLSFHDSCWRSATESKISSIADWLNDRFKEEKNMTARTCFSVFGTGFIDGNIAIYSSERKARFIKLDKQNAGA